MSGTYTPELTGTTFILYCCPVCGRTITDRQPYYAVPNLNCRHGMVIYQMKLVGSVKQWCYEDAHP